MNPTRRRESHITQSKTDKFKGRVILVLTFFVNISNDKLRYPGLTNLVDESTAHQYMYFQARVLLKQGPIHPLTFFL